MHNRTSSSSSMISSHSTVTGLSIDIEQMVNDSDMSTDSLVASAQKKLTDFEKDPKKSDCHPSDIPNLQPINRYLLLKAMLEHAPTDRGRRYVSAAIMKCNDTDGLIEIANTWIKYLLLPFKGNRTSSTGSYPLTVSDIAMSTSVKTEHALSIFQDTQNRHMTPLVKLRDGYKCWITEVYHDDFLPSGKPLGSLKNCHIIKRAIGAFNDKERTCFSTWEIINYYIGWDLPKMQEIIAELDSPANGMLVLSLFQDHWEKYGWSLKPVIENDVIVPNTYEMEVFDTRGFPDYLILVNRHVTFIDHGNDPYVHSHMPEYEKKFISKPRPVPNPELIALHRAICGVLHMSGAGKIIDRTFRRIEDAGLAVLSNKIRSADDLVLLLSLLDLSTSS